MDLLNHHPGKDGFRLRGVSMSRGCLIALVKHLTGRYRGRRLRTMRAAVGSGETEGTEAAG